MNATYERLYDFIAFINFTSCSLSETLEADIQKHVIQPTCGRCNFHLSPFLSFGEGEISRKATISGHEQVELYKQQQSTVYHRLVSGIRKNLYQENES